MFSQKRATYQWIFHFYTIVMYNQFALNLFFLRKVAKPVVKASRISYSFLSSCNDFVYLH
jgi:hypothetical protein